MEQFKELALPPAYKDYQKAVLTWIKQKATEGMVLLRKEKAFTDISSCIDYVNGEQFPIRSRAISNIVDNRIRKIVFESAAALTSIRPIWSYLTNNEEFKKQSTILNKLARAWWRNSFADRKLRSALIYSYVGGSGYLALTWNPNLSGGGDLELISYDPRDVIPIGPVYSDSIQDWQGVILRQRTNAETIKKLYPSKAEAIGKAGTASWFVTDQAKGRIYDVASTVWSVIKGRSNAADGELPDSLDLMRVFIKDGSLNTGSEPVQMGDPDSNHSYWVYPVGSNHPRDGHVISKEEAMLYPRGRLIVGTPDTILHDGPNPYWHGMFPLVRVTLDPTPWSILGSSIVGDLLPIQNALNESLRGAEDAIAQWIRRGVIADKRALHSNSLQNIDTRKSGMKVLVNPTGGEAFKIVDGPQLPDFYLGLIQFFRNEIEENSGIKEFKQLSALKQNPNENEIEKYMDALSPLLQGRARSIELVLGEIAEMIKVGFFQYYNVKRRIQILGDDGITIDDFDYDPGSMVPDFIGGSTREERAQSFHRNFTFSVAQDSFLNVNHIMKKMLILQLFRANGIDIYSMWDAMDIPDVGPMPAETVPERMIIARKTGLQPGPTPELVQAQEQLALAQVQAQLAQIQAMEQQAALGALPGQMAPQMGGEGQGVSNSGVGPQGGRPPTGAQPPMLIPKDGGSRVAVSESGQ